MVKQKEHLSPEKLKELVIEGMDQKKAQNIVSINFKNITNAITDYFVICHGTSTTQVEAIADNVYNFLRKKGVKPWHTEGRQNAEWILLDYIDIVVHVFLDTSRDFYSIEKLWADAEQHRHTHNIKK